MNTNRVANIIIPMCLGMFFIKPVYTQNIDEVWTHSASACAIDESSIALAEVGSARLFFKPNQTGTIYARCNVTNPKDNGADTNWNRLEVALRDSNGGVSASPGVKARLWRVSAFPGFPPGNGGVSLITTLDSINCLDGDTVCSVPFAHDFDFDRYAYFVELEVHRAVAVAGNPNVSVSAVRLLER